MECKEAILSNDIADIMLDYQVPDAETDQALACYTEIDDQFVVAFITRRNLPTLGISNYVYNSIPKLYGLMQDIQSSQQTSFDPVSLIRSGILQLQRPPLSLTGNGVVIGLVDTGIDYNQAVFKRPDGTSRILAIWDQTIQDGQPPEGFFYGTEYSNAQINEALASENPKSIVPSTDEIGHGTAMASVAAGSDIEFGITFRGAAPDADIVMVKLKDAKPYLREYYFIPDGTPAYSETDIGMAVKYLNGFTQIGRRPVVICLGLGTNWGDHAGNSILSRYLSRIAVKRNRAVVVCGGNEGNASHHFNRSVDFETPSNTETAEVRVGSGEKGFVMELWGDAPNIFSVSIRSPGGEIVQAADFKTRESRTYSFVYEKTKVTISHILVEQGSGEELVVFRFEEPTPGVWTFEITVSGSVNYGMINMWLPITKFLRAETYFLRPTPYITLTEPSLATEVITVSTYDDSNNSFYADSGRGFSRNSVINPQFAAPGVNISTSLGQQTGSGMSAAITAGACAQFMQWAVIEGNEVLAQSNDIKTYFIRGAERSPDTFYPNRSWGYGRLNVARAFQILAGLV